MPHRIIALIVLPLLVAPFALYFGTALAPRRSNGGWEGLVALTQGLWMLPLWGWIYFMGFFTFYRIKPPEIYVSGQLSSLLVGVSIYFAVGQFDNRSSFADWYFERPFYVSLLAIIMGITGAAIATMRIVKREQDMGGNRR